MQFDDLQTKKLSNLLVMNTPFLRNHVILQVDGRALKDSIRITTTFPEMEKTYSSLNILRYVKGFIFLVK